MDQENSSSSDPSTIHIQVNTISTNNNEATIDNIHTEDSLLNDIYSIENNYLSGYDSPITMSLHGSNSNPDSYHNSDDEDKLELHDTSYNSMFYNKKTLSLEDISNMTQLNLLNVIQESNKKQKYKKLSLNDIERSVEKYYGPSFHYKYTTEVDFLTTYMKGQKNLYTQAKNNSQWKLNCLMIPSLLLTCGISIVNPFIGCDNDIHLAVLSGLNALVALLLSIINYSKLESSTQIFFFMANQYDKYETILEMTNSKLMLLEKDNDKKSLVLDRINEIEEKILDLIEAPIKKMGFEVVRIRYLDKSDATLQIMIDQNSNKVEIDDCANISTTVSTLLDVDDPLSQSYTLEVSSPGINRPLTRKKDFQCLILCQILSWRLLNR